MPAQIAPTQSEQVFISRSEALRVIRFRKLEEPLPTGGVKKLAPGLTFEFDNGVFRVTDEVRTEQARYIEKYGHLYDFDTYDDEFLSPEDYLRKRGEVTDAVQEVGIELPDSGPTLQEIARLAIDGEEEALVDLHEQESQSYNRPDVIEAVEHALRKLEERRADPEG